MLEVLDVLLDVYAVKLASVGTGRLFIGTCEEKVEDSKGRNVECKRECCNVSVLALKICCVRRCGKVEWERREISGNELWRRIVYESCIKCVDVCGLVKC